MKDDGEGNCKLSGCHFVLFIFSRRENLPFTGVLFSQKLYLLGLCLGGAVVCNGILTGFICGMNI